MSELSEDVDCVNGSTLWLAEMKAANTFLVTASLLAFLQKSDMMALVPSMPKHARVLLATGKSNVDISAAY